MITYIEKPELGIIELIVEGKVTNEDFDAIAPRIKKLIKECGNLKVLEELRDFKGFDLEVLGKGIKFDMKYMKYFTHCAVVSDHGWVGPLSRMTGVFVKCDIRVFKQSESAQARQWLEEQP